MESLRFFLEGVVSVDILRIEGLAKKSSVPVLMLECLIGEYITLKPIFCVEITLDILQNLVSELLLNLEVGPQLPRNLGLKGLVIDEDCLSVALSHVDQHVSVGDALLEPLPQLLLRERVNIRVAVPNDAE